MQNSRQILLIFLFGIFLKKSHGQSADTSSFKDNSFRHKTAKVDTAKNMFAIKTDILFPIVGRTANQKIESLTLEKGFHRRHSVQLTGLYSDLERTLPDGKQKFTTLFIFEDYKLFWSRKKCFTGFYSGIFLDQMIEHEIIDVGAEYNFGVAYTSYEYKDSRLGGGLIIGYQNYIRKKFTIDLLFGFGWGCLLQKKIITEQDAELIIQPIEHFGRAAISLGYRF